MPTRREFLKAGAVAGVALFPWKRAFPYEQSPNNLRKFIIGLPGLGPSAKNEIGQYIPVAIANTGRFPGNDYYQLVEGQYTELLHPDLPKATKLWGYGDANSSYKTPLFKYLGPVILAQTGRPVRLTLTNDLPATHILPVDASSFMIDAQTYPNKTALHLHGGHVPWISDGGPYAWFTPGKGPKGPDYPLQPLDMKILPGKFNHYYPNDQGARFQWYHDHAHDVTRLNAYAGLASAYLISDAAEAGLISDGVIPAAQIPLIIQDKGFKTVADQWGQPGDLWYPSVYEPNNPGPSMAYADLPGTETARWDYGPNVIPPATVANGTLPLPSAVPEAFFDTILVNGAVYPYVGPLPAKRYRLQLLNGSNARFLNLQLYVKDNSADGITLKVDGTAVVDNNNNPNMVPNNDPGPAFIQIGSEGGFLPNPVVFTKDGTNKNSNRAMAYNLNVSDPTFGNATRYNLLLAPAERADVIIDLRGYEGQTLILYSDAPAPFPGGDIRNDYYVGAPDLTSIGGAPAPQAGYGPNTRTLMVIKVGATASDSMDFVETVNALSDTHSGLPAVFSETQPPLFVPLGITALPPGVTVRSLTLNEDFDDWGRLVQRLGTTVGNGTNNQGMTTYGRNLADTPTETPHVGDTEVWQLFNNTADTHPIHFHLVNVQIISRAQFDPLTFTPLAGTERGPDPNETGWKETVRMNPGEVTTVIMQFILPNVATTIFDPTTQLSTRTAVHGHEYVYHCHILEHEEHDMMRPLIVVP